MPIEEGELADTIVPNLAWAMNNPDEADAMETERQQRFHPPTQNSGKVGADSSDVIESTTASGPGSAKAELILTEARTKAHSAGKEEFSWRVFLKHYDSLNYPSPEYARFKLEVDYYLKFPEIDTVEEFARTISGGGLQPEDD